MNVHLGISLGDALSLCDVWQQRDTRSRTSPIGSTMTAPTIPNDLRRPSAEVVANKGKNIYQLQSVDH